MILGRSDESIFSFQHFSVKLVSCYFIICILLRNDVVVDVVVDDVVDDVKYLYQFFCSEMGLFFVVSQIR